jgi:hypothetical protein
MMRPMAVGPRKRAKSPLSELGLAGAVCTENLDSDVLVMKSAN